MVEPFALNLSKHTRLSAGSIPLGHKGERKFKLHEAESIVMTMSSNSEQTPATLLAGSLDPGFGLP
jgi:hypothetical protein